MSIRVSSVEKVEIVTASLCFCYQLSLLFANSHLMI